MKQKRVPQGSESPARFGFLQEKQQEKQQNMTKGAENARRF